MPTTYRILYCTTTSCNDVQLYESISMSYDNTGPGCSGLYSALPLGNLYDFPNNANECITAGSRPVPTPFAVARWPPSSHL